MSRESEIALIRSEHGDLFERKPSSRFKERYDLYNTEGLIADLGGRNAAEAIQDAAQNTLAEGQTLEERMAEIQADLTEPGSFFSYEVKTLPEEV